MMKYYRNSQNQLIPHDVPAVSRRDFLARAGGGFGMLALNALLGQPACNAAASTNPLAARQPHLLPRAKNIIWVFCEGGPSHIDLFDPKPLLNQLAGQPLPDSFGSVLTAMGEANSPLLECRRKWKQHGQGGLWISDWLPNMAGCADELAVLRGCWADGINHSSGVCQMNTGRITAGRPSLGSWVSYGLGTENRNLPSFVVMRDRSAQVVNGPRNWGAGFMPAVYQGTEFKSGPIPIENLTPPENISLQRQQEKLSFLNQLNRQHATRRSRQTELDARIASYELAFRMQSEAPEAVDLKSETEATRKLYGMDRKETATMGRLCLLSRRLVERGVRFVQIYSGSGSGWDAHDNIEKNHGDRCREVDAPVAGLIKDLKSRGLLDETLIVWGGEFGRTPMSEKGDGRDHNPTGFSMVLAGGGVQGGQTIGATDELGLHAIEDRMHVHDFHATLLWLLGIDNMDLVYMHKGRPERPTLNEGRPMTKLV